MLCISVRGEAPLLTIHHVATHRYGVPAAAAACLPSSANSREHHLHILGARPRLGDQLEGEGGSRMRYGYTRVYCQAIGIPCLILGSVLKSQSDSLHEFSVSPSPRSTCAGIAVAA